MDKGTLIEFRLQGERRLAVVDRPEGKKDWMVIDEGGHAHKIRPQRVEYTIHEGSYHPGDIPDFVKQVQPLLDPSSLEVAWELIVGEGETVTAQTLAQLLFSSQTPACCYAAHYLLSEDKIYFKCKGDVYEPRPVGQIEEIKHQLEVEQQRQHEKEEFIIHLKQALAGNKIEWTESDRSRLESVERFVLQPEQKFPLAQEILALTGRSQTPETAFELLVDLGWWSSHENLFLRRSSYPIYFSKKVLEVTQSCLDNSPQTPT